MKFDVTYQGAVMKGSGAVYQYRSGGFYGVSTELDGNPVYRTVALTGYTETSSRGNLGYQTRDGNFIILSEGWTKIGTVAIAQYSQTRAQALVDKIIKNNITIVQNNLVCARFASKFTEEQQIQIRDLQRRAENRKNALVNEGLCSNIKTSYPKGYADLGGYLDALMNGEAIGVVTWATVVLAALVIASMATACYFAYKLFADESEQDVKYSKELMAILQSKLTEEEYQMLLDETQGIVTKAKIRSAAQGIGTGALLIAGLVGVGILYNIFKRKRN